ncbi:hypothetical protein GCM10020295_71980 [Streptomyces cinereospinus]
MGRPSGTAPSVRPALAIANGSPVILRCGEARTAALCHAVTRLASGTDAVLATGRTPTSLLPLLAGARSGRPGTECAGRPRAGIRSSGG